MVVVFENPQAQTEFNQKYNELISRLPNLFNAIVTGIDLAHKKEMPQAQMTVLALARMALEDFRQILLLCSNGETTGGMKLLRGMFERVVTATYIHRNPEEADAFINYFPLTRYKEFNAISGFNLSEEAIQRLKDERDEVRERYLVDDCKKCGTKKINHSWTKIDIPTMAKKVGLDTSMLTGYYFPMQETHATMASIERRMKLDEVTGRFTYEEAAKPGEEEVTLSTTHYLALGTIMLLRDCFQLENFLEPKIKQCVDDFNHVWRKSPLNGEGSPKEGPSEV